MGWEAYLKTRRGNEHLGQEHGVGVAQGIAIGGAQGEGDAHGCVISHLCTR